MVSTWKPAPVLLCNIPSLCPSRRVDARAGFLNIKNKARALQISPTYKPWLHHVVRQKPHTYLWLLRNLCCTRRRRHAPGCKRPEPCCTFNKCHRAHNRRCRCATHALDLHRAAVRRRRAATAPIRRNPPKARATANAPSTMAPLTWRVDLKDLRKGFKVKSSSPAFAANDREFCLDVYREGWGDDDRDLVAVFVRYASQRGTSEGVASVSLKGGPSWRAPEATRFAPVADLERRSRSGNRRFCSRDAFLALAEKGPLVFTVSVDNRVGETPVDIALEEMTEADVRQALLKVDREEIKGRTDPKVTLKGSSHITQLARNTKFMTGLYPIVMRYLRVKKTVGKMRKKLKAIDREAYYDERTAMWDAAHEREAVAIRRLFDSMGGLYNKLAQDWATRDGLVPQAWVDELKHSFEGMPFREWTEMSRMLLSGLEKEGVAKVKNVKGLDAYFASVDQKPLAAASIGQVHTALTYSGERVVVKAIYPEIRRYLIADLKNARKAAQQISWVLKLPMKGTIDAIMDEEVECFPRSVTQRTLKLLQLE